MAEQIEVDGQTYETLTDLAKAYFAQYQHLPKRQVARMMHEDYPELFPNIENARNIIRTITGANGNHHRHLHEDYREAYNIPDTPKAETEARNRFNVPEPTKWDKRIPYYVPESVSKMLLLYDLHIPYHDKESIEIALEYGYNKGVDAILFGGDALDMYQVSRFTKLPDAPSIQDEIDMFHELVVDIKKNFMGIKIYFMIGNHEARWNNYLFSNAPMIGSMRCTQLEEALECENYGITFINEKRNVVFSGANLIHGHEYEGWSNPVSPARGFFLKAGGCVIGGHYHTTTEHEGRTIDDRLIGAWSVGCLCDLNPTYRPKVFNKWNNGFGYITRSTDNKWFYFKNKKIEKGQIL